MQPSQHSVSGWYQYKCNRLFSLRFNANTRSVQSLPSVIDIESEFAVTWWKKEGKDNLSLSFLHCVGPGASSLRVKHGVSDTAKNILESCLHFLLHCPKPVPQSGSWAQKHSPRKCHLRNEAAASCRDGTRGEFRELIIKGSMNRASSQWLTYCLPQNPENCFTKEARGGGVKKTKRKPKMLLGDL